MQQAALDAAELKHLREKVAHVEKISELQEKINKMNEAALKGRIAAQEKEIGQQKVTIDAYGKLVNDVVKLIEEHHVVVKNVVKEEVKVAMDRMMVIIKEAVGNQEKRNEVTEELKDQLETVPSPTFPSTFPRYRASPWPVFPHPSGRSAGPR